jgi:hypothetical protein
VGLKQSLRARSQLARHRQRASLKPASNRCRPDVGESTIEKVKKIDTTPPKDHRIDKGSPGGGRKRSGAHGLCCQPKKDRAEQQEATSSPGKRPRLGRDKGGDHGSITAALDINQVLPVEILRIILVDNLNALYDHVYVERVCHAWRDIVASKQGAVRSTLERSVTFMENAAFYGHLAIIRWALSERCPRVGWVGNMAAAGGHLDLLNYLYSIDWHHGLGHVYDGAARGGHWHVMSWARDKNYRGTSGHAPTLPKAAALRCSSGCAPPDVRATSGRAYTLQRADISTCSSGRATTTVCGVRWRAAVLPRAGI